MTQYNPMDMIQTMTWEEHRPIRFKAMDILNTKGYTGDPLTEEDAAILWSYILDSPDQERDEGVDYQQDCYDLIFQYDKQSGRKPEKESYNERDERINAYLRPVLQRMREKKAEACAVTSPPLTDFLQDCSDLNDYPF